MSLRTRIAVLTACAVAVAVVAVSAVTLWAARVQFRDTLDAEIRARAVLLQATAGRLDRRAVLGRPRFSVDNVLVQVITGDGRKIYKSADSLPVSDSDLDVAKGHKFESWSDVKAEGVKLRVFTVGLRGVPQTAVMTARPLTEIDDTIAGLRNAMAVVAVLGVAGAGVMGFVVAGSAMRPVRKLTAAAADVAQTQDLTRRIEPEGAGELSDLAASFNTMLETLSHSRTQQRRLVTDAGHELRTPLTSLRTNIELLLREQDGDAAGALSDEDRRALLRDVRAELTELTALVAETVALASDEHDFGDAEPFDLAAAVEAVAERHRRRSGRPIETRLAPCTVVAVPARVERAVSNLIDNALKWGPPGSPVEVAVADGVVTVRDHGPGIDAQHRDHVFERFYRAPEARSLPGSGLGLSIVHDVARAAGGTAAVVATEGAGATVELRLPPASS